MTSISLPGYAAMNIQTAKQHFASVAQELGQRKVLDLPQIIERAALGTKALDGALALKAQLPVGVVTAMQNAREQAIAATSLLQPFNPGAIDFRQAIRTFNETNLWLDLAHGILALEHGPNIGGPIKPVDEGPFIHPPAPLPGDPGSPITIEPLA